MRTTTSVYLNFAPRSCMISQSCFNFILLEVSLICGHKNSICLWDFQWHWGGTLRFICSYYWWLVETAFGFSREP